MEKEILLKKVPKGRRLALETELSELVDKVIPIISTLIPLEREFIDIKERYAKLKVPQGTIQDLFDALLRQKDEEVYKFFSQ